MSYYYPSPSAPVSVPQKQGTYPYPYPYQAAYGRVSVSPPEHPESSTGSGVPSYDPSAASTSYAGSAYAGSASEYDSSSSTGTNSIDLLEYMNGRLADAYNPEPLDRSLAKQAQTSGQINDKTRQLRELQALAQQRLAAAQSNFAEGIKSAKEVQRDLQWTQKRVSAINQRAARKYPAEYKVASQRYPAPVDY
ncbi:hypothetical protein NA57DRAFT_73443 [Rhizodiscina lignyota]|uniref:Biogenesis of lysosome-related organelles complex 1 subunit KXD1 n=1 Tax=Rhizodiscina lignyota TaxID=1504668 RepID=A0A9P4IMA3_9PEZI|nr:hypothetical protein NA57DRAFT_73443 [Rhizodiscina lignyota]